MRRVSTESTASVEGRSPGSAGYPSVGTNARWSLAASATYALAQWAQYAIIVRVGGASALGGYAYALALAAPVVSLANLQLGVLLASDPRDVKVFGEYHRLRLITTAAAAAAIVFIAWVDGVWAGLWPMVLAVCAMRAADALADIYGSLWQKTERLSRPNLATMLRGLASLAFMGAAAALGGGAAAAVGGAALGSFVALLFLHVSTARDGRLRGALTGGARPSWRAIGRLAAQGTPMGVIVLLLAAQVSAPQYFIRRHGGDAALGIFAAASQLTATGLLVINAIGGAAIPRLARYLQAGDSAGFVGLVRRAGVGCAALGGAGVLASALVGKPLLATLYRPEFAAGWSVLVVLSVASTLAFPAAILGYALTTARVILAQCGAVGASLVVLLATCGVLVPRFGALGAAWAIATAAAVHLGANAITMRLAVGRRRSAPAGGIPGRPPCGRAPPADG